MSTSSAALTTSASAERFRLDVTQTSQSPCRPIVPTRGNVHDLRQITFACHEHGGETLSRAWSIVQWAAGVLAAEPASLEK
jgi:hypothetical protein